MIVKICCFIFGLSFYRLKFLLRIFYILYSSYCIFWPRFKYTCIEISKRFREMEWKIYFPNFGPKNMWFWEISNVAIKFWSEKTSHSFSLLDFILKIVEPNIWNWSSNVRSGWGGGDRTLRTLLQPGSVLLRWLAHLRRGTHLRRGAHCLE